MNVFCQGFHSLPTHWQDIGGLIDQTVGQNDAETNNLRLSNFARQKLPGLDLAARTTSFFLCRPTAFQNQTT
jgi:hypothetical protein